MHPLQQQLDDLRKYHDALGTKLASFERHLDPEHEDDIYDAVAGKRADEVLKAPTMERQPAYTVSSDGSVMHEGKRYSFKYSGAAIENVLILKAYPRIIHHAGGVYNSEAITNVREVKEPAKEWEIVEFYSPALNRVHCKLNNRPETYYSDEVNREFTLSHILDELKARLVTIHAVRRLSDGTVWRVGTITTNGCITGFEIRDINMMVIMDNGYSYPISLLTEAKALFTTADGAQVPKGAAVCFWYPGKDTFSVCAAEICLNWDNHYSTYEAAQAAYDKWLFEQPVLTLNDVTQDGFPLEYLETMKQIVKDKIAKK